MSDGDEPAPSLRHVIAEDLRSFAELKRGRLSSLVGVLDVLLFPGVLAVLIFRLAGAFHRARLRPISRLLYIADLVLFSVDLAPGAKVGPGLALPHPVGVAIAPDARIGRWVRIFQGVSVGGVSFEDPERDGFPTVGDRCWIFSGAKVLGPIDIGDDAMIASNALVIRSVPPGGVVVGNPARVVRYRSGYGPSGAAPSAADGAGSV
ncbi:MAG TPA: serine O-acetyltransferase [Candidatus Limnocylindria bacterium]|nr:serine O-acetyltransferase [Candidatus Limnocylindria bacterium]